MSYVDPVQLNRIAGTTGKDPAVAASIYAGLSYVTDVEDALNRKLGTTGLSAPLVLSRLAGLSYVTDANIAIALISAGAGSGVDNWLLENGTDGWLLEDGSGVWLLES